MKKKIGIITYHAAYNYGSALQAYATQEIIKLLGYDAKIINYRMIEQKKYYAIIRTKFGKKRFIEDISQLPLVKQKILRSKRFEEFFNDYYDLTYEFSNPDEIYEFENKFEVFISGSDQIWNKHSCELNWNEWKYMFPYLLKDIKKNKVSYASSIGNMTDNEIATIKKYIEEFDSISMREYTSTKRLEKILNKDIKTVLDPTFLLNKKQWIEDMKLNKDNRNPYILYYSLGNIKDNFLKLSKMLKLAKARHLELHVITPYFYIPILSKNISNYLEYGPKEFLNELYNAELVVTDSYHGSILSVNLGKEVYSICEGKPSDFRKIDIFNRLGLEKRILESIDELMKNDFEPINYQLVQEKIQFFRKKSIEYLEHNL